MRATWYILEDGSAVDPNEVTRDESGALTHKNGKIAVGSHGNYRTSGVDLDDNGKPLFTGGTGLAEKTVNELKVLAADMGVDLGEATKKADIVAALEKALEPDGVTGGYKTRESKAE